MVSCLPSAGGEGQFAAVNPVTDTEYLLNAILIASVLFAVISPASPLRMMRDELPPAIRTEMVVSADWLAQQGVSPVAMESTGVYWKPVWHLLEGRFELLLVNAQHIKQVPGRKTDVSDAAWIAGLLRHGLLRPSFIPDQEQRELREVTRYRRSLVDERTAEVNRLQKTLEGANIKLASGASAITI